MMCPLTASAQTDVGVVRGQVLDVSDGVLPGVTVVASAVDGRTLVTTITNEVGHYVFTALPSGPVQIAFQLEGFEPASVEIKVQPGTELSVVERLKLAQITESVVVVAKAPEEPPPPPPAPRPAPIPYRRPPPPVVIPVPAHEIESICRPAKPGMTFESLGTIQSHYREAGRTLYGKGDELNVDRGTLDGFEVGKNLVVRRYYRVNDPGEVIAANGEHTAGLVQIIATSEHTSTAIVIHACSEVMKGDFLASFVPEPVRPADPTGTPTYQDAIRILFADSGQMLGAPRRLMVIDRGSAQGIRAGQRLTLFRGEHGATLKPVVLGDAVVVAVRDDSATIRIENATDAISLGDWAAPQSPRR
jgi:hypothetical protein